MSLYKLLGVPETANNDDIVKAYRNLVKIHHPDMITGNKEKFIEIQSAYETLIDPSKRKIYDKTGRFSDLSFSQKFDAFTKDVVSKVIMRSDVTKKNLIGLIVAEINIQRTTLKNHSMIKKQRISKLKEVERRLIHNKYSDNILMNSLRNCIQDEQTKLNELTFDINFLNSCQEIVQGYDYNIQ